MIRLAAALVFALVFAPTAPTATGPQDPVSTSVPELEAFHDVMVPIWHTAYPAKDYAELRKQSGAVESGIAKIVSARLSPILHEKETAWAKGLSDLKSAGAAYRKAAAGTDDGALLAAAEGLHTAYEALVRVIRPVVKEMDEFHKALYVMQHTYVPERKWDAVCGIAGDLVAKAEAVARATLPKRVEARAAAFKTAAEALVAEAKALAAACRGGKPADVEQAAGRLHDGYQRLEQVFE